MNKTKIYERFMEELDEVRGFDWRNEWNILGSIDVPIKYVGDLVEENSLEIFSKQKHLNPNFTGFVNTQKKNIYTGYFGEDYINFIFIEKGKVRYFQHSFREKNHKLYFFDENFKILKGYPGEGSRFGNYVHRFSNFKLNDLNIQFNRISKDKSSVLISKIVNEKFFSVDISPLQMENISEEIFQDYDRFFSFFNGMEARVYSKEDFDKKSEFKNALKIIKR